MISVDNNPRPKKLESCEIRNHPGPGCPGPSMNIHPKDVIPEMSSQCQDHLAISIYIPYICL
jgi:hypothetical protein